MRTCLECCHALQPTELREDGEEVAAPFVIVSAYSLYVDGLAPVAVKQAAEVRCFLVQLTHQYVVTVAPHHSPVDGAAVQQLDHVWHLPSADFVVQTFCVHQSARGVFGCLRVNQGPRGIL